MDCHCPDYSWGLATLLVAADAVRPVSSIGAVNIVVGLWQLVSWNRFLLAWAAALGLITALSRLTGVERASVVKDILT